MGRKKKVALKRSPQDVERVSRVTEDDIEAARVRVRETNPELADLLDAQPKKVELREPLE